jgi:hypothetical protein
MWKTKIKKAKLAEPDPYSGDGMIGYHDDDKKAEDSTKSHDEDDYQDSDEIIEYENKEMSNKRSLYMDDHGKMPIATNEPIYTYNKTIDRNYKNPNTSKRDLNWETQYEALVMYASKHGHCNVRSGGADAEDKPTVNLYAWLALQRRHKKSNKLRPDREQKLQQLVDEGKLGWFGDSNDKQEEMAQSTLPPPNWESMYEALLIYAEEHGHANVPLHTYITIDKRKNVDLGLYVNEKRQSHAHGTLDPKQVAKLNILYKEGKFAWSLPGDDYMMPDTPKDVLHRKWMERFTAVAKFALQNRTMLLGDDIKGTLQIDGSTETFDLEQWIFVQRKRYSLGQLEPERTNMMETLVNEKCFLWMSKEESDRIAKEKEKQEKEEDILWNAWYNALLWQAKNGGHCNLENDSTIVLPDGSEAELGKWLHRQRSALKKGALRADRASKIKSLVDSGKLDHAKWHHIFILKYPSLLQQPTEIAVSSINGSTSAADPQPSSTSNNSSIVLTSMNSNGNSDIKSAL